MQYCTSKTRLLQGFFGQKQKSLHINIYQYYCTSTVTLSTLELLQRQPKKSLFYYGRIDCPSKVCAVLIFDVCGGKISPGAVNAAVQGTISAVFIYISSTLHLPLKATVAFYPW